MFWHSIQYNFDLAVRHHQSGRLREAEEIYRQILSDQPKHADALHLLGVVAYQVGRVHIAADLIRRAISLRPNFAEAYCNLGNALKDMGQFDEAIGACRRAISLRPNFPEAGNNLGVALRSNGQLDDSVAALRQTIALTPNYADAQYNLGVSLSQKGQADDAIAAYRRAVTLKPDYIEALCNLGRELAAKGEADEAIAIYRRAVAIDPHVPEVLNNLGNALRAQGQLEEALAVYSRAVGLRPDYAQGHYNLAIALCDAGRGDEALVACRRSIDLEPEFADAHNTLGHLLKNKGELREAVAAYRRALALRPNFHQAHSNLLYALLFDADCSGESIAEAHRQWNLRHAKPLRKRKLTPLAGVPERRLRIGYVSPDLRDHVIGRNLLPLFREHNHQQFEIFCYDLQNSAGDALTAQFRSHADCWRRVSHLSDAQIADQICRDQIDVLVDLSLHMAGNRLLVFARKPAPVQVTFAGYPGSTGLAAIDYRLSDAYLDPLDAAHGKPPGVDESIYSEKTIRLPDSFWCYDPLDMSDVGISPLPALSAGVVTFGCLNNFCKMNEPTLALWAQALRQVQNSRLLLLAPMGSHRQQTLDRLSNLGVEPMRVAFSAHVPRRQYLELYHHIDIGLDTFPYNGHTTSLDSFWMGVPVVTRIGQSAVARAGWCQVSNLGLQELAASTPEQFVKTAVELANDFPRLQHMRQTLRHRMEHSPLMDGPKFARGIEDAYRNMWNAWRAAATLKN